MTSAFSWQNSASLCPASFCTPRPNLPVTPGICFPIFEFQSAILKNPSFWGVSSSVVSDSVRPRRWQPTRLRRPWDSPGKNTRVGCHFLLRCMKKEVKVSRSVMSDSATPWTEAYQAPPSTGFSRQEYWSGVPLPSPVGLHRRLQL